jgi:cephalosporin hydroxylase
VKRRVGNGKVLLILDSLHTRDHVLRELELYSPLVGVGGYIVVQDSNVNGRPVMPEHGPGPGEAVDDFLAKNKNFVQDKQRERLLLTMHPGGYLKRVS